MGGFGAGMGPCGGSVELTVKCAPTAASPRARAERRPRASRTDSEYLSVRLNVSPTLISARRPPAHSSSTNLPPSIPAHIQSETAAPTLHADIIGAYPSSHLGINETPAPLGGHSPSFGQGTPASPPPHKHHSSFDRPHEPMIIDSVGAGGRAVGESALADGPSADSPVPMHPTVAETGVPIAASGPGPSSGQLPRREPAHPDHIVKLGSFGSADAPGAGAGGAVASGAAGGVPPTYEASGREQAEAQLRAMGVMPGAFGAGAGAGTSGTSGATSASASAPGQPLTKEEEARGDQLPRY